MNKTYAKKINESVIYPYVLENLRKENPELSLPEDLSLIASDYDIFEVLLTDKPQIDELTQTVTESTPVFVNGHFIQTWSVNEKFDEEKKQIIILEQSKANKLAAIEAERMQLEAQGWNSGQGFSLGISPNDIALLTGVFSLAKEASAMGIAMPSIISLENKQIDFNNIQEMTTMLLQYGAARAEMSKQFAAKIRAVEQAITVEEVLSI